MAFRDRLKNLTKQAQKAAAEHKDGVRQTVEKAEAAADQQTGGRYHDKIEKAGGKVDAYLEDLESKHGQA